MLSPRAVSIGGLLALASAMGVGRFAFTPLLPMMQADAGLTLEEGGWLAAANYAGYLAGAIWAAALPLQQHTAIRSALLGIALATAAMGLAEGFAAWLVLRALAGVASAWALVHVSAWALARLADLHRPLLGSLVYAGVGAGIVVVGLACLVLMQAQASSRVAWLMLGAFSLVTTGVVWRLFGAAAAQQVRALPYRWDREALRLVLCYGAFGFGYIVPATFLPVMARAHVADPVLFGWAWPLFGAAAAASTLAAARLLARSGNRGVWIGGHLVMALGVVAPLLVEGLGGILLGALCVGGTFMVVTMAGLQEARGRAGPHAARLMAAMTAAFALGQIAGPALASIWLRAGGTLGAPLWIAWLSLVASALALLQRR